MCALALARAHRQVVRDSIPHALTTWSSSGTGTRQHSACHIEPTSCAFPNRQHADCHEDAAYGYAKEVAHCSSTEQHSIAPAAPLEPCRLVCPLCCVPPSGCRACCSQSRRSSPAAAAILAPSAAAGTQRTHVERSEDQGEYMQDWSLAPLQNCRRWGPTAADTACEPALLFDCNPGALLGMCRRAPRILHVPTHLSVLFRVHAGKSRQLIATINTTHRQQRVFQLNVPVGYALFVAVVHCKDQLLEEPPDAQYISTPTDRQYSNTGAVRSRGSAKRPGSTATMEQVHSGQAVQQHKSSPDLFAALGCAALDQLAVAHSRAGTALPLSAKLQTTGVAAALTGSPSLTWPGLLGVWCAAAHTQTSCRHWHSPSRH